MKTSKIAEGSNKNLWKLECDDSSVNSFVAFEFSDRISVFDWGPLDCDILDRGKNLERFALALARHLDFKGIAQACDLEMSKKEECFVSKRVSHPKHSLDSNDYVFLPLEFIVRWGIPQGSSLLKRAPEKYSLWQRFEKPMVEYSTKLEAQDRMLEAEEAQALLANTQAKLNDIEAFLQKLCPVVESFFDDRGLEIWDAKFELAINLKTKKLMLVDAITPDELRLYMKGLRRVPLSKELLRLWLRQTPWFDSVALVKSKTKTPQPQSANWQSANWQSLVKYPQPQLGVWRSKKLSHLYEALAKLAEDAQSKSLWNWIRQDEPCKVAVIGGGGREEALRWRLKLEGVEICDAKTVASLMLFKPTEIDAVFVSMDNDLEAGLVDELSQKGFWTFGPTKAASKLEWSKLFGREVAVAAKVPTPFFSKNLNDFERGAAPPHGDVPVLKLDGLAAGKGVFLFESWEALDEKLLLLNEGKKDYYFEERCEGFEASIFFECLRDSSGRPSVKFLGSAQDFKRRFLGDEGPNTGGMGAWVPHPKLTEDDIALFNDWAQRTVQMMDQRGNFYRGILYIGAMRDSKQGWKLIEYNARFGDPETQALVGQWPRGSKILRSMLSLSTEFANDYEFEKTQMTSLSSSLCLSLVHPQYPEKAVPIELSPWEFSSDENSQLFLTTSKTGRLAYIVAQAPNRHEAGDKVFEILLDCPWKDLVEWRTDILK